MISVFINVSQAYHYNFSACDRFAAEIFHGLQEEVMITCSRSHKLVARVQQIEAAVSPIEKTVLAQRNHLYFAYSAGMFIYLAWTFSILET